MKKYLILLIFVVLSVLALVIFGIFYSWWVSFSIALIILGTLGYVERILKIKWSPKLSIFLLIVFVILSAANIIKSRHSEKELNQAKNDVTNTKGQISNLSNELKQANKKISDKDARIYELERKAKVIRTIDGNIECVFSGNWGEHPGSRIPAGWNRAQVYARIFERNETEIGAILFLIDNIRMTKLPDGNLKVNFEVRAKAGTGPLGQELDVLKKYGHLSVYIPFIFWNDTLDNKITLRELRASFFINGEKKTQLTVLQNLEIPIPEGKAPGFQLSKKDFFIDIFR